MVGSGGCSWGMGGGREAGGPELRAEVEAERERSGGGAKTVIALLVGGLETGRRKAGVVCWRLDGGCRCGETLVLLYPPRVQPKLS